MARAISDRMLGSRAASGAGRPPMPDLDRGAGAWRAEPKGRACSMAAASRHVRVISGLEARRSQSGRCRDYG